MHAREKRENSITENAARIAISLDFSKCHEGNVAITMEHVALAARALADIEATHDEDFWGWGVTEADWPEACSMIATEIEAGSFPEDRALMHAYICHLLEIEPPEYEDSLSLTKPEPTPLASREIAIALAALRMAQEYGGVDALNNMPHLEDEGTFVTAAEIDGLCERLNCGRPLAF